MLTPAPIAVASPARKASLGSCVAKATAKIGASVDREPSMSPVIAGCARWSRNDRWSRCPRVRASMWLLLGVDVNIPVVVAAVSPGVGCRCAAAHPARPLLDDGLDPQADRHPSFSI